MINDELRLSNEAPIIVTWIPKTLGASLPDGKNSKLNYLDILVNHKKKNKEDREIYLVVNGPGFNPDQIEELEDQLKRSKVDGIYIVDLHKYDWSEIDREWRLDNKSISIQKYYENMYNMADKERTYFAIEIDTFRLVALALLEQFTKQKGGIYIDFDSLSAIDGHIGKNITIPKGILLGGIGVSFHNQTGNLLKVNSEKLEFLQALGRNYESKVVNVDLNNNLIAINNPTTAVNIIFKYNDELLSQSQMCSKIKTRLSSIINEKKDQLTTGKKEGIEKFISDIDNNGIKALYDINNFKYIVMDGVDMNVAQTSTVNMVTAKKVSECMQFSFGCNNGNYCQGKSDLSWTKENLHKKDSKTPSELLVNKQNVTDEDSKIQLNIAHVQDNVESTIELFAAAKEGNVKRAQEAISLGADVNAKGNNEKPLLYHAIRYSSVAIVKLLIENGADLNLTDKEGNTPLDIAKGRMINPKICQLLDDLKIEPVNKQRRIN